MRFSVLLSKVDVETLRRLCREHGKTLWEMLSFAIQAADSLLAGCRWSIRAGQQRCCRCALSR